MRLFRDFDRLLPDDEGAVIALGNFDGVHLGHQAILRECAALARAEGRKAAAMTFEPHPREFFGSKSSLKLYPFRRKCELLAACGIQCLFVARFNAELAGLSAEAFVREMLHKRLRARHVVTGFNFAFGKGRGGTVDFLMQQARSLGFGFTAHPPVAQENGAPVSSTAIREAMAGGHVRAAGRMLGRPYAISGHVLRGKGLGKSLGFATANLRMPRLFPPRLGIYAAKLTLPNGVTFDAAASLGFNPAYPESEPRLEAHAFGLDRPLYGEYVSVALYDYLREERFFATPSDLVRQMEKDCRHAKRRLHEEPEI